LLDALPASLRLFTQSPALSPIDAISNFKQVRSLVLITRRLPKGMRAQRLRLEPLPLNDTTELAKGLLRPDADLEMIADLALGQPVFFSDG
jgi:hypothetical protein